MVIENLETSTLAEWLLGRGWIDGWLWQTWVIAVVAAALLLALYVGVRFLRSGDDSIASGTAFRFGMVAWICTFLAGGPLLAIVVRLTTPDTKAQGAIDSVFIPLSKNFLEHLLGKYWLEGAVYVWLLIVWGLFTAAFALCWIFRTASQGPIQSTTDCGRALLDVCRDVARMSPRRVLALAYLAWREAIRRRVWMVFFVFVAIIMFAGWFLQTNSEHPAQLFIQFVLNWTMYLTMVFALVLSALSLPQDIQDRTLHTIVTKPVRKLEVLVGRLLGFTAMGTVLLASIGVLSFVFTTLGLNHTHLLTAEDLQAQMLPGQNKPILSGLTSLKNGHRHEVTIGPGDNYTVEKKFDHTHALIQEQKNGVKTYWLGPPEGFFEARVPIYSRSQRFTNPKGETNRASGVNVGDEWMYRSFIAGGTGAAGVWTFKISADDFPPEKFPAGIPIEMTIEPFRTHKGDMERGVLGTLWMRNPDPDAKIKTKVTIANFQAKKFATDTQYIPFVKEMKSPDGKGMIKVDFFDNIVSKKDGTFEIGLECLEHGQYFGMAQPDLYIRASDASFVWNFTKGYIGIWMQMVLVLTIALFFSTFVSGPVALLATLAVMLIGWFRSFVLGIAVATIVGGGPLESAWRMGSQDNQISQLPPGIALSVVVELDKVARLLLRGVSATLPPFADFDLVKYVAFGFDINNTMLAKCLCSELAYILPVLILAYFCLRAREIAK